MKTNFVEVLRRELARPAWTREQVGARHRHRSLSADRGPLRADARRLEACRDADTPVGIVTKGPMVVRDIDVLQAIAARTSCSVYLSVPTIDDDAWRRLEPGTAPPLQRLRAVRALTDAGIHCGVLMAPLVPGITTRASLVEATIKAAADHGARSVGAMVLHLEGGTRTHFMRVLAREYPHLVDGYERLFAGEVRAGQLQPTKCSGWSACSRRSTGLSAPAPRRRGRRPAAARGRTAAPDPDALRAHARACGLKRQPTAAAMRGTPPAAWRCSSGQQRRPRHEASDFDVLVQRVGAVADRAQAVERRHAERGGEVAVGPAAGAALGDRLAELGGGGLRRGRRARATPAERSIGGRSKPPVTASRAPGRCGAQGAERRVDAGGVGQRRRAHVDDRRAPPRPRRWAGCRRR